MAKIKINTGTPTTPNWLNIDAGNLESVDGIHFRVNNGKLEYSQDGTTWYQS